MSTAPVRTGRPFSDAVVVTPLGDGRFRAVLDDVWAIGPKAHGGLLMVLMARAALARLADATGADATGAVATGADANGTDATGAGAALEPLAVAADFLRAPDLGPIELDTEVLKTGRTVSVCAVRLTQGDRLMLTATVSAGALPTSEPRWADPAVHPTEPGPDAVALGHPDKPTGVGSRRSRRGGENTGLSGACEIRYPPHDNPFARGETGPPRMSGWVRPRGEEPNVLFALLAGDVLPPTVFNLGGTVGWAPTVQLTALLRGHPAPGWLRVDSETRSVAGTWFDEDVSVVDSAGRLVCQARQIALAPRA